MKADSYDVLILDENEVIINNEIVLNERRNRSIKNYLQQEFKFKKYCPFCNNELIVKTQKEGEFAPRSGIFSYDYSYGNTYESGKLWYCSNCAFWQILLYDYTCDDFDAYQTWCHAISKKKEFDIDITEDCKSEIAQSIRRNKSLWNSMDPKELEIYVKEIFSSFYNNCEVYHIGKPYDKGIDVLFIDSDKNEWLIQVKRRKQVLSSEGISTIRNLLGTLLLEDKRYGIVVSTADHFTYEACKNVNRLQDRGYRIELIDKHKLDLMLDPLIPKKPWLDFERDSCIKKPIDEWLDDTDNKNQITLDHFNI
ncbi:MAG: restriction endonuclease [Methanospirillum sp.]